MKIVPISPSKKKPSTSRLFSSLPFCPILNNESVYSWCSRLHRLYGHVNAVKTCRLLFDHISAGLCHDFPRRLSTLVKTAGLTCDPETLLTEHTALGLYKAFLTKEKFNRVVNNTLIGRHPEIKTLLGIHKSCAPHLFALKFCPECVLHSMQNLGYSTWETIHQWPTIHVCHIHDRILISAPKSFHNKTLIEWHLPHDELVTHWPEQQVVCVNALETLSRIRNWSMYLTQYDHNPLDSNLLRILYHLQARNLGFVDLDGSIKFQQIKKKFMHEYKDIISIKGFEFLSNVYKDHGGMLGVTLKQYSGDKSPLIQILMIDFLFDSHTSFSKSYQLVQSI